MTRGQPIPLKTRRLVWERSGHLCECGCGIRATHIHHRKLRSQGGTNDPKNLLHLALECHERIHHNPDQSYALGLLVRACFDPADVPVTAVHA